jgi:hypothetical protein
VKRGAGRSPGFLRASGNTFFRTILGLLGGGNDWSRKGCFKPWWPAAFTSARGLLGRGPCQGFGDGQLWFSFYQCHKWALQTALKEGETWSFQVFLKLTLLVFFFLLSHTPRGPNCFQSLLGSSNPVHSSNLPNR